MDDSNAVHLLKELLASRHKLPAEQLPEMQQLVMQYGHSLGLAMFHPMIPAAFQFTINHHPRAQFGLKFGASFQKERNRHDSLATMARSWEMSARVAFCDPTLNVLSVESGSIILRCESSASLSHLAQCAVGLARGSDKLSLPPLEGFAANMPVSGSSKIEWLSPSRLKKQLQAAPSAPRAIAANSQLFEPEQARSAQPGVVDQIRQDESVPLSREDFEAIAAEFGDVETLERIRTDPSYQPWVSANK